MSQRRRTPSSESHKLAGGEAEDRNTPAGDRSQEKQPGDAEAEIDARLAEHLDTVPPVKAQGWTLGEV